MTASHDTLTFDRALPVSPDTAFRALSSARARAIWAPPTPEMNMHFIESDFRVGGRDLCRCGPGPAQGTELRTLYHVIETDARLVFTEIIGDDRATHSLALVTMDLSRDGSGSALRVTVQAAALSGDDVIAEMRGGWTASLDNLVRYLGSEPG